MDLLQLFSRKETIGGLEISDNEIKLTVLTPGKKPNTKIAFAEEHLPAKTINSGKINNPSLLEIALNNLLKNIPRIRYVILSLPPDKVFTKILSFPKNINHERLPETVRLQAEYHLPLSADQLYVDWESSESKNNIEVLLAAIEKNIVDAYFPILAKVGLKIVAVEIHPLSLLRAVELPENSSLIISDSPSASYFYFFDNKKLRYQRTLPKQFTTNDNVDLLKKQIIDSYESEHQKVENILSADKLKPKAEFISSSASLVSLGAAIRGRLPRSQDTMISLTQIGTEKAHELQKAVAFTRLVRSLTFSLSIFFILVFLGVLFLVSNADQRTTHQVQSFNINQSDETSLLEAKAKKIKNLTDLTYPIIHSSIRWSELFDNLSDLPRPGIIIANVAVNENGTINISGKAASRNDLNQFKKALENLSSLANINLPLVNLEQKSDIPFAISANLKLESLTSDNKTP